ncbi:DUF3592 domain-containing protein [Porticoccaceae bacterium LTM1]|nr:DUF3592 domain-containing protein [Porticoccaceae bacterium LTM1]
MNIEHIIVPVFWAIGVGGIIHSIWSLLLLLSAKSWPVAAGEIVSSGIDVLMDCDGDYSFKARVEYNFWVEGRAYAGKRIGFGVGSWSIRSLVSSAYRKATSSYPKVKVRSNPRKPERNTILVGFHGFHVTNFVFFWVWCLVLNMASTG